MRFWDVCDILFLGLSYCSLNFFILSQMSSLNILTFFQFWFLFFKVNLRKQLFSNRTLCTWNVIQGLNILNILPILHILSKNLLP